MPRSACAGSSVEVLGREAFNEVVEPLDLHLPLVSFDRSEVRHGGLLDHCLVSEDGHVCTDGKCDGIRGPRVDAHSTTQLRCGDQTREEGGSLDADYLDVIEMRSQ